MAIAIISDIHGNAAALTAVLKDIQQHEISSIVNLGDHFSGPLNASETAEILIEHKLLSIRGNHDRWLIEKDPTDMGPSDIEAYKQLDAKHLGWLESLPPTSVLLGEVLLCHGSPTSDTTYLLETVSDEGTVFLSSEREVEEKLGDVDFPVILCGHTHIPRAVHLSDGRLVVNPGSVGCPAYFDDNPVPHVMQTGTPLATYAVLEKADSKDWKVAFRYIPYDNNKMAKLAAERKRKDWQEALSLGRVTGP